MMTLQNNYGRVYIVDCFLLCPVTDILAPISVKFSWWYICVLDVSSPFWGQCSQGIPKSEILGLNFGHLTVNISKTVSRSVTHQLELNISYYKQNYVAVLSIFAPLSVINARSTAAWHAERHLCVARRPSTQSNAYRRSVDGTLLTVVTDTRFRRQSRFLYTTFIAHRRWF